jgi:hypothetical protein
VGQLEQDGPAPAGKYDHFTIDRPRDASRPWPDDTSGTQAFADPDGVLHYFAL